jgi:hypothetical protein
MVHGSSVAESFRQILNFNQGTPPRFIHASVSMGTSRTAGLLQSRPLY